MAENMKTRISKWDLSAELHVETVVHDSAVPAEVDNPCMDLSEEDSIKPIQSMNVQGSEINQSANQSGEERNNNIVHSEYICEKTQCSEQFDLEGDCKDGFKKQGWEPASHDRTMAQCAEKQENPHKVAYDKSHSPEERPQSTRNMSPIDERNRSHRKRSRSRSRSRSLPYNSRSRSRSKSPSSISKQGSERLLDKGRTRVMTPPCRAFAAGKCRWGRECRFLHEGGSWGQTERHHDDESTDGVGNRPERERHPVYTSKESHTDTSEKNNHTRERASRRTEEHYEDGRENNNVPHEDYRSNERCFDFTRGRCQRGETCRYVHHDASSDGGSSVRDESRGRVYDNRRDGSVSFNRRPEHQRLSDVPCKYFLRGHCIHGDGCKFYHQTGPPNIPVERSLNGSQHSFVSDGSAGNITSANASKLQDQTSRYRANNPRGENELGVGDSRLIDKRNFRSRSISNSHPVRAHDAHKETQHSVQKTITPKVSKEVSSNNHLPTISVSENSGQSQIAPQLLHGQSFASNSSFQQFAHPFPLKGPMQHGMRSNLQNEKNQFAAIHKPPDDHSFNSSVENLPANPSPYQLNPQNLDSRQIQHNLSMMSQSGSNFNFNNQIQLNGPLIHNAQNQPDLSVGAQIQQNLSSRIGHGHQDIIGAGDSQQVLPQTVQSQAQIAPPHASNGQNDLQIFNSEEKNRESTLQSNSIQIGQAADSLEVKRSPFNPDNSITHKVVTSEQAAKIIDLSASLAQFFGTAAQNSQSATMAPQAFLNPNSIGSFVTIVAPPPAEIEGSQTNLSLSTPKPNQQIHVIENMKQGDDSSSRDVKKLEAHGINKEQLAQLQNGDAEGKKDGDGKKIKEAKEIRMFKCTLVEFVKEILKPKWKEGQLSKEAYKTIVKKVVDKVCGSLQGPNVPQTQEKIDLYLLNSKAKLSKLVQAYVEKFVNS